jgi:imidazolonepropionase-like amidohydrolase
MSSPWIRCGALVTGYGETPRTDMAIRVEDGLIADIRNAGELPRGTVPVDLSTATVAPGFIDAHVHLLFTSDVDHERTRASVEQSRPAKLALIGARNALECLLGGITTVRDCGDIDFITLDLRDAVASGATPGPRILAAGPPLTTSGGHLHWCGNTVGSADEIRRATRQLCARGVDLVKVMASGGNMTRGSNRLLPQFETEDLGLIVAEAHQLGRRVAAHALNTESIRRAVRAGVDTIEHCTWVDSSGEPDLDLGLVKEMARLPVSATLTMAGISRVMLPDYGPIGDQELRAARDMSRTGSLVEDLEWARLMRAEGVRLTVASDGGVRFTPFRRFDQSIECAMTGLGLTASEAIELSTLRAAEALGIADQVGSIDVGKQADLVVLDGVMDDHSTRLGRVRQVWRAGSVLVDGGRVSLSKHTNSAGAA